MRVRGSTDCCPCGLGAPFSVGASTTQTSRQSHEGRRSITLVGTLTSHCGGSAEAAYLPGALVGTVVVLVRAAYPSEARTYRPGVLDQPEL